MFYNITGFACITGASFDNCPTSMSAAKLSQITQCMITCWQSCDVWGRHNRFRTQMTISQRQTNHSHRNFCTEWLPDLSLSAKVRP